MRNTVFIAFLICCADALAEPAPLKVGLWQIHAEGDGQSTSDTTDRLKNVPPEARKQIEAMMKQRGVDISSGDIKMCMDQKLIETGAWQQDKANANCKVEYSSRTSTRWVWKAVCAKPESTTDAEVLFKGPEAYSVTSTTTTMMEGKPIVKKVAMSSKWLGADCGDVKPVSGR